jgi:hypothetical protein
MRIHKILSGIVVFSAFAASTVLAADQLVAQRPWLVARADQAGKPPRVAYWGYGTGELALPLLSEDGRMSGVLVENDGLVNLELDALLTGCIPATGTGSGNPYWFGGIEGRVLKLDLSGSVAAVSAVYSIEGTWKLDKHMNGTFEARMLDVQASGRVTAVGTIYGKFRVSPIEPLRPGLDECRKDFRDRSDKGANTKLDDALSLKKGGAWSYRAAHSGFVDVRSRPTPLVGPFALRFVIYQ